MASRKLVATSSHVHCTPIHISNKAWKAQLIWARYCSRNWWYSDLGLDLAYAVCLDFVLLDHSHSVAMLREDSLHSRQVSK